MSSPQPMPVDQSFNPPSAPDDDKPWPSPTRTAYPLKPSDTVLDDGRLVSNALGRIKHFQHEHRVIVRWVVDSWVVVRPRLVALPDSTKSSRRTTRNPSLPMLTARLHDRSPQHDASD